MSAANAYRKFSGNKGLTLIEVLIALAIVSIAMTAIVKATSQHIRATHYLEQKTESLWVAQEVLNRARVGLLKLPRPPAKDLQSTNILGDILYWQAWQEPTPNKRINKLTVNVFVNENDLESPILHLETYLYQQQAHDE